MEQGRECQDEAVCKGILLCFSVTHGGDSLDIGQHAGSDIPDVLCGQCCNLFILANSQIYLLDENDRNKCSHEYEAVQQILPMEVEAG